MHPTISYELAKARIADLRGQAERAQTARAARRARPARAEYAKNPVLSRPGVLARRALSMLGARSA